MGIGRFSFPLTLTEEVTNSSCFLCYKRTKRLVFKELWRWVSGGVKQNILREKITYRKKIATKSDDG